MTSTENNLYKRVCDVVNEAKTPARVRKALQKACIRFSDTTELHAYFNLEIPVSDGRIRIYVPHKERHCVVQRMTKTKMVYSGVPVFFG